MMKWRKSTRSSSGGQCVEIGYDAESPASRGLRDSKNPAGPALTFSADAMADLLSAAPGIRTPWGTGA